MSLRKQQVELELTRRFLTLLGHPHAQLEAGDRPDLIAIINVCRIGIEETKFHSDEQPGTSGSHLRAEEAKKAKQAKGRPYSVWGVADPLPGIVARIEDKIERATKYDARRYSELWLLISSQLPMPGAVAATFAFEPFVSVSRLNETTHGLLSASPFAAAHLHLAMTHGLYSWSREKQWHGNQTGDLFKFDQIKSVINDPEWRCDPDRKAREEAHKAVDELLARRQERTDPENR